MRISGCRLGEKTQDRLAEFFVGGVTGRTAADLIGVNRKTAAYFFHRLRQIIARPLEDSLPVEGLVEVDESYFGGVRKGKRGRGAEGKTPFVAAVETTDDGRPVRLKLRRVKSFCTHAIAAFAKTREMSRSSPSHSRFR